MQLIFVHDGLELGEGLFGESRFVKHNKQVDALAADGATWQGLLAHQEPIKRWPLLHLRISERCLHAINETTAKTLLRLLPLVEVRDHGPKRSAHLIERAARLHFLLHLLAEFFHLRAEELLTLLGSEFAALLLRHLFHLLAGIIHCAAPLILHLWPHHRRHHLLADLLHLIHDLFASWLKCILIVTHQLFNNSELCILKGELLLEERNVTAHKVRLKRIPDLVLNAHPTHAAEHAAATATTLTTPAAALTAALAATTLALPTTLRRRCALLREHRHRQK